MADILSSHAVQQYCPQNPLTKFLPNKSLIQQQNKKLASSPTLLLCGRRSLQVRGSAVRAPMAALMEVNDETTSFKGVSHNDDHQEQNQRIKIMAMVSVRHSKKKMLEDMVLHWLDQSSHTTQRGVVIQLVSTDIDPRTRKPKVSKKAILDWSKSLNIGSSERVTHSVEFWVDSSFGVPGAITAANMYRSEFFLETINIEGVVHFSCNSWVQPETAYNKEKRIFFSDKVYLPGETPAGLKELREKELKLLRGDGEGLRLLSDRIYDYDKYNDLGYPDKGIEYVRPILGGENHPHPRRCRTGRPPNEKDLNVESPVHALMPMYVPRDEAMEEPRRGSFDAAKLKGVTRNVIPTLLTTISDAAGDVFNGPSDININNLYIEKSQNINIFGKIQESIQDFFKFDSPKIISRDTSCYLRDDEFGHQVLAGINPVSIERLEVFPPVSKLDPSTYGPLESSLKEEHIICHLEGMSVQQALDKNKLYILDYHDTYLPFLNRINAMEDRKAYGTRTIFFLTSMGTLKPIAIELSLPPPTEAAKMGSKQVLTPPVDATTYWLWQLAKAHVCSNDSGVHQLVHHWLRTHACMEPFIIAAQRQLSIMHPVFKLLDPHIRHTLEINALARESLINAGGIIESNFTPGKYCMDICCAAYKDWWRFDLEGLPADLIRRGVAVPDPTQPHGLKLLIEDYPYANDGLLIWSAIETLVHTYVNYYYPDPNSIISDAELQAWYQESINVGHADLRHASWWPKLSSPDNLASVLTTIIWLASAQHAAINYGQYPYGGYVPTRPPLMRRLIPQQQDPDQYSEFLADPQGYFSSSLPSLSDAAKYMSVLYILSTHSPDEEYIGERKDLSSWLGDPEIIEAFYGFSMEMRRIEKEIEKRNSDPNLKNRCGAGITPYELLLPSSGPGVTGRGVPNSVTI